MSTEVKKTAALKVPILPHDSPEAPQPPSLKTPLYPHQLRALHRCLLIENDGSLAKDFGAGYDYTSRGGCLADAVGMGKTATSIGLVLSSHRERGEGDTLVVAPSHLVHQWKAEIEKFSDDIEVLVGKREYLRYATLPPEGKSHRIVLVDVETILGEHKLWYDWRRVFSDKGGYQVKVDAQTMEKYKKAALFSVKSPRGPCSYEGYVYTGPLHHPFRPWRRVIFDEIQDLVSEGTESQKNLLQLSRTAKNVWLLSATPFPHGNKSVYANHELLGFCRLRLNVEVDYDLSASHPFEIIKRKLYIRSPKHVADDAVTASKKVKKETLFVDATALERKFFELEQDNIASRNKFDEQYASLRQMINHPEASKKLREQINGRDDDFRGGQVGRVVQQKNKRVGRFATVNSFAKQSLNAAKARSKQLEQSDIPQLQRDIELIRSSWYLALKIRQVRQSPVQANPFARREETAAPPICLEIEEAKAIHSYYCQCPEYGSSRCEADAKAQFQTMGIDSTGPTVFKGYKATEKVINYFKNEVRPGRMIPTQAGSSIEAEYLDIFVRRKENSIKTCQTNERKLYEEKADVEKRITALEATVEAGNVKFSGEDEKLAARNGSKCAALIRFLWEAAEKGEQTLVFSYWHDALALVLKSLKENDLSASFCNGRFGSMMAKAISEFTSGEKSILLLSAQAKASGANLQCATNVVLLDPAGDNSEHGAALEQQAIGRAVRMGQENAVKVVRFCVRDTVEEELFNEIDLAAAKLETRNNDSSYVCQNAHKSLDEKVLAKKEGDEEVFVGESVSAKELLARNLAVARAKNEIIDLVDDDSDDETVGLDGDSKPKAVKSNVPMEIDAPSASQAKVKTEPSAEGVATAKRAHAEVAELEEAASAGPDKRAKVVPSTTWAGKAYKCMFEGCGMSFGSFASATAHERLCEKKGKIRSSVIDGTDLAAFEKEEAERYAKAREEAENKMAATVRDQYAKACKIGGMNNTHHNWIDMYLALKLVKEKTGKAWVPGQKDRLGKWCASQRRERAKYMKGTHSNNDLAEGRIKLLTVLGFPWSKAAEATPNKPVTVPNEKAAVVSPPEESATGDATPSTASKGSDAGARDEIEAIVPKVQATPGKVQTEHACLKDLLAQCDLGGYLEKFLRIQVTTAAQLLANLQDLAFMQRLIESTGLTAMETVRLQIVASKQ